MHDLGGADGVDPFSAAGVINGIGHYWGYRNFQPGDASRNIVPWGILIGGEELHNNHHAYATSARLSSRGTSSTSAGSTSALLQMLGLAHGEEGRAAVKLGAATSRTATSLRCRP